MYVIRENKVFALREEHGETVLVYTTLDDDGSFYPLTSHKQEFWAFPFKSIEETSKAYIQALGALEILEK